MSNINWRTLRKNRPHDPGRWMNMTNTFRTFWKELYNSANTFISAARVLSCFSHAAKIIENHSGGALAAMPDRVMVAKCLLAQFAVQWFRRGCLARVARGEGRQNFRRYCCHVSCLWKLRVQTKHGLALGFDFHLIAGMNHAEQQRVTHRNK